MQHLGLEPPFTHPESILVLKEGPRPKKNLQTSRYDWIISEDLGVRPLLISNHFETPASSQEHGVFFGKTSNYGLKFVH